MSSENQDGSLEPERVLQASDDDLDHRFRAIAPEQVVPHVRQQRLRIDVVAIDEPVDHVPHAAPEHVE